MNDLIIAWWSAGATSAVACKLAIQKYGKENVVLYYFKIDSAHEDNARFMRECESWYGLPINVVSSLKYKDQFDVIEKTKYVNGAAGARCTKELKKEVRYKIEREVDYSGQIFGFEFEKKEVNRALRFLQEYPTAKPQFPLIENKLTKANCLYYLKSEGIEIPVMYKLGYPNNNCIGCVKGGAGYWNKIRIDYPDKFKRMADLELSVGRTCLRKKVKVDGELVSSPQYLHDLNATAGRGQKIIVPDCGLFCDIELADIEDDMLSAVIDDPQLLLNLYL